MLQNFAKIFIILSTVFLGTFEVTSEQYCLPKNEHSKLFPKCVLSVENLVEVGQLNPGIAENSSYLKSHTFPAWFNPDLAKIGQNFARKNAAGICYGAFLFALVFLADTDIRRVLVDSGKSTEPEKAFKRYVTNLLHAQMWFQDDIELEMNVENIFKSLNGVRARHVWAQESSTLHQEKLRRPLISEPKPGTNPHGLDLRIWKAFEADLRSSHFAKNITSMRSSGVGSEIKFNQHAMAIGQFLHFGIPVMVPKKVLIYEATDEEFMGFIHLGAFLGKAVGVEDEFNICLQRDAESAKKYLRIFFEQHLVPTLLHLDYETKVMYEAIFKGFNNGFFKQRSDRRTSMPNTIDFFLLRLLEDVLEVPAANMNRAQTRRERFATRAFKWFSQPTTYKWARDYTNSLAQWLIGTWSMVKFGIDTRNSTIVAEKAFV